MRKKHKFIVVKLTWDKVFEIVYEFCIGHQERFVDIPKDILLSQHFGALENKDFYMAYYDYDQFPNCIEDVDFDSLEYTVPGKFNTINTLKPVDANTYFYKNSKRIYNEVRYIKFTFEQMIGLLGEIIKEALNIRKYNICEYFKIVFDENKELFTAVYCNSKAFSNTSDGMEELKEFDIEKGTTYIDVTDKVGFFI